MLQIIYASSASQPLDDEELQALFEVSKRNNEAAGVTGLLLYKDGNFLQLLEGEKNAVQTVYERVRKDPRHKDVILLHQESLRDREFVGWSMGLHNLATVTRIDLPGFVDMDSLSLRPADLIQQPSRAHRLLSLFAS